MKYLYIFGTVLLTVYGQIMLKWRVSNYGPFPYDNIGKVNFLLKLLLDPFIISSFLAAFLAALFWMVALTKFELSHAYPFVGITFVLVLILSRILFNETITHLKVIGVLLIILGIFVGSQG